MEIAQNKSPMPSEEVQTLQFVPTFTTIIEYYYF